MNAAEYKKLIKDNITQSYKKCDINEKFMIDQKSAILSKRLDLDDRIQRIAPIDCFITLKDHKPNFQNDPKCRLINPAKNELGKVSQQLLKNLVSQLTTNTNLNLWKNTSAVIDWFKTSDKTKAKFIKFDIVDFYPSISEELLSKAIHFAKSSCEISDRDLEVIKHTKSSLLFNDGTGIFDVTMGSYDGAETCELVGLYLLNKLTKIIPANQLGLYRDDGLSIIPRANGPKMDKLRKYITKNFKNEGLKITCETNLIETDYLDVNFKIPVNAVMIHNVGIPV